MSKVSTKQAALDQKKRAKQERREKNKKFLAKMAALDAKDKPAIKIGPDDLKTVQNMSTNLISPNQLQNISINSQLGNAAVIGVMTGYLSSMLGRGLLANLTIPDEAYWAYVWGTKVLTSLTNNSTLESSQFPHWLMCLGQAMAAKSCPFKGGLVTYNNALQVLTPTSSEILSPGSYNYKWLLYVPGPAPPVNGFPTAVAPIVPSDDQAQEAWTKMINFIQASSKTSVVAENGRIQPFGKTKWMKDVSAFAYQTALTGWSFGETGGWSYTANLEVPILTPLLSGLQTQPTNNSIQPSRFANYSIAAASSAIFVGGAMSSYLPENQWRMKRAPRFHYIDFLEFADVIAQWVSLVCELWSKDQSNTAGDITCPITLQEMQLLLRNELMFLYGDTQPLVQSNYQQLPNVGTDNVFSPFLCGTTTVGLQSVGMKLPMAVIENAKCLVARSFCRKDAKGNKIVKDPQYYIPVLGKYANDLLTPTNYTYKDQSNATVPSFLSLATMYTKKKIGDKEVLEPQLEPAIDLVDGSSGSSYLFINDQKRLTALVSFWNEWIARITSYSQSCATISKDLGPPLLVSIGSTNHWKTASGPSKVRSDLFVDMREASKKNLSATIYSNRQRFAVSNQAVEYAEIWKFVAAWILPVNTLDTPLNIFSVTDYDRVKEMMGECYAIQTTSTGDVGQLLSELHASYAAHLIKPKWGAPDDWEAELEGFRQRGGGGVLASLASVFAGGLFGADVGHVVGQVGNVLGF